MLQNVFSKIHKVQNKKHIVAISYQAIYSFLEQYVSVEGGFCKNDQIFILYTIAAKFY